MKIQKLVIKIPRNESELIPFDLEKWNTGEYEAVHNNDGIGKVLCTDNGGDYPIIVAYGGGRVSTYALNGKFHLCNDCTSLFLRKKSEGELPNDVYNNIYTDGTGLSHHSIEMCKKYEQSNRLAILHITYEWEN